MYVHDEYISVYNLAEKFQAVAEKTARKHSKRFFLVPHHEY